MTTSQCPVCYALLEVRDVTPCWICGGWPESRAASAPQPIFTEFRLPDDQRIVLCPDCELEEFMVPGGWGERLCGDKGLPINALHRVRSMTGPMRTRDKFCPVCHLRLAFLRVVTNTAR